jgi:hypothetical protein
MSIAGLFSSGLLAAQALRPAPSPAQKLQQEFKQVGSDLASGNLRRRKRFATLQSDNPQLASATSTQPGGTAIATQFKQLSNDLQAGNLSGAQQDFASLQQSIQTRGGGGGGHHHHVHSQDSSDSQNPVASAFAQLGQALQAGNLSTAQSAYATLQQDFLQQQGSASTVSGTSGSTNSNGSLSVSA